MDTQRKIAVVRSLASAATAAGLVFASWSTPANAAAKSDYHGIDVSMLRTNTSVLQGPVNPMRVNSDIFSPRDSKGDQKTKNPTKGTGSKSKAKGSATGTNSATKQKSKDGSVTKGTGSKNTASKANATNQNNTKNTKEASKARGSVTGTNSATKAKNTADSVTKGTGSMNTMSKHEVAPANNAANNNAPAANGVLGVQTPPMVNGTQTLAGAVNQQANGVVKGVETLPSTSTAAAANLAGAGLALIASGGSILVIKRRRT